MLRSSEAFLESMARGSDEPMFSVSPSGRVVWWGHLAESLFGYSRQEAVGRAVVSLVVHADSVEAVTQGIVLATERGEASCLPRCKGRDGRPFHFPLPFRIARRGEGAGEDLLFTVGPHRNGAEVLLPRVEAPPAPQPPFLAHVPLAPPPEGIEAALEQALRSSHDPQVLLARAAHALVPAFARGFAGVLLEPGGRPRLAAQVGDVGADLSLEPEADRLHRAAESGVVVDGARLLLRLLGRTRCFGYVVLARDEPFASTERAWVETVGRRMAIEIENVRLASLAQREHEESRRAMERVQQYERLTGALSEATTPPQVLEALMGQAAPLLGATAGAIAVMSADRTTLEVVAASGGSEALTSSKRSLAVFDRAPLAEAARSGQMVLFDHLRTAVSQYEHLARLPDETLEGSLASLPLVLKGRSIGAFGLLFPRGALAAEQWTALHALGRHCADAMERVRLYEAERRARAEASEEARRLELLADASRILAQSLDYEDSLRRLAEALVPSIADWCAFYRVKNGVLEPVVSFHRDAAKRADLDRLVAAARVDAASPLGVGKVLATGRPVLFFNLPDHLLPGVAQAPEELALLRSVGVTSQMMVPLATRDEVLGVLIVTYAGFRRYAASDVVFVEALARRIGVAIENARLYQAARESQERYRLLVDGVRDHALFYLDAEGRIATWSPAAERLLGYTTEEALGLSLDAFYEPEAIVRGRPRRNRDAARRDGRYEEDGIRVRKDGSRMHANVVITALHDEKGGAGGFVVLMRDMTETVRAREALDRARQQLAANEKLSALGTLVSGVAHEIRTPLTAMANNLHILEFRLRALLKRDPTLPVEPLLEQVDGGIQGIERLNRLVEDLRKFARVKAGTIKRDSLDVPIADALRLFSAAHRGHVEVEAHLSPTPLLEVDVLQVQQVVLNLLQNAAEAMPHGGKVRVTTRAAGTGGELVVEDEGLGMTDEVRARMFEEFFTTKPQGTGLGLSIVRRIVEAHRGTIECRSARGQGARFVIHFPARLP